MPSIVRLPVWVAPALMSAVLATSVLLAATPAAFAAEDDPLCITPITAPDDAPTGPKHGGGVSGGLPVWLTEADFADMHQCN